MIKNRQVIINNLPKLAKIVKNLWKTAEIIEKSGKIRKNAPEKQNGAGKTKKILKNPPRKRQRNDKERNPSTSNPTRELLLWNIEIWKKKRPKKYLKNWRQRTCVSYEIQTNEHRQWTVTPPLFLSLHFFSFIQVFFEFRMKLNGGATWQINSHTKWRPIRTIFHLIIN